MRGRFRSAIASLAVLMSSTAKATDLTTIDRSIAKEPSFRASTPGYAVLVFGPEAKRRVWIVADGDTLYVDRDGDGDLTDEGEKVRGEVVRDGLTRQRIFRAGRVAERAGQGIDLEVAQSLGDGPPEMFISTSIGGRPYQAAVPDERGTPEFAARAKDAPIIHFDGPMKTSPLPDQKLPGEGESREFYARVGTPGLGKGTFAALAIDRVPANVHPVAVVDIPTAETGRPPTQVEFVLGHRC